jgi:GNAT superfamily N-acetyltransferase
MNIRKAVSSDVSEIVAVHIKSWQTTYKNIIPDDYLSALSYVKMKYNWRERLKLKNDKTFTYVVENETGKIIGFSLGSLEQQEPVGKRFREDLYKGELMAIYLLEEYQRKGIGRKLVFRTMNHLIEKGITGMITWVLKENPSSKFYESIYGKIVGEGTIEIGGIQYIKCAYGWENLTVIIKKNWK